MVERNKITEKGLMKLPGCMVHSNLKYLNLSIHLHVTYRQKQHWQQKSQIFEQYSFISNIVAMVRFRLFYADNCCLNDIGVKNIMKMRCIQLKILNIGSYDMKQATITQAMMDSTQYLMQEFTNMPQFICLATDQCVQHCQEL